MIVKSFGPQKPQMYQQMCTWGSKNKVLHEKVRFWSNFDELCGAMLDIGRNPPKSCKKYCPKPDGVMKDVT